LSRGATPDRLVWYRSSLERESVIVTAAGVHRLTIAALGVDPRRTAVLAAADALGIDGIEDVIVRDLIFIDADLDPEHRHALEELLVDPLLQTGTWSVPDEPGLEVVMKPGVADHGAEAVLEACRLLGISVRRAATGRRFDLTGGDADDIERLAERVVANSIIERWAFGTVEPHFGPVPAATGRAEVIAIRDLDDSGLDQLNRDRALYLDPVEMVAIRDHFTQAGRDPTDAELETLAQTWSEHCAHKTFRARLLDESGDEIEPLLTQLRHATEEIAAPFVRSAFVGNAGIVSFHSGSTVAIKAETHNHPSAIEPFGGANTGVGGVIRDVLGIGHQPIAVTDVLCFGPPDLPASSLPAGALHPRRIRDGVVAGVADYGNKIGLPTVAGAVLYDPGFTLTPLVFCGCLGVAADGPLPLHPAVGDRVVLIGGRTGRDGLGGATFSSATMDASTGEVAGAKVQIGSPIVEKLVSDVLDGGRHLYRAITDCGAGGLSSAIGEMAEELGADIELDRVPLKYPGLEPWEIWLSEAQERMVLAVDPADFEALAERCGECGVEVADLGSFTGTGRLIVRFAGVPVVDLETGFLHDGRPGRTMELKWPKPQRDRGLGRHVDDPAGALLGLLGHRNLGSKASIISQYDHEIRGATRLRPLTGVDADAPSDGVVLVEPGEDHGLAIGIGVNPWYGLVDPEAMAHAVIDEAIRSVVAVGADPERIALLDNFSWGDPRRPETLGQLAAAVRGCCEAAVRHGAPFVSGKDSLNNEYLTDAGVRTPVPPTLVITAVAPVPDADAVISIAPTRVGSVLALLGRTNDEFGGSHLDLVLGTRPAPFGVVPQPDPAAPARYRGLHRAIRAGLVACCHDVSEGGLAVTLAEMVIASGLGIEIERLPGEDQTIGLFSESIGRLVVEIAPHDLDRVSELIGEEILVIGSVIEGDELRGGGLGTITRNDLRAAYLSADDFVVAAIGESSS